MQTPYRLSDQDDVIPIVLWERLSKVDSCEHIFCCFVPRRCVIGVLARTEILRIWAAGCAIASANRNDNREAEFDELPDLRQLSVPANVRTIARIGWTAVTRNN